MIKNSETKKFSEIIKRASECIPNSCPSGAYFVSGSDSQSLYRLGSQIGGPQSTMRHGETDEWSNNRYAILIAGGTYDMPDQFKLGYYTQVAGASSSRDDVRVLPGINVLNNCEKVGDANCKAPGGLDNFWRSFSDISMDIGRLGAPLRFAVSQASPMRNLKISGQDILMCDWGLGGDCGFTSGGFMSKISATGKVILGSQQQFYVTNSNFSQLQAGAWNIVSNGNQGSVFGDGDVSTKNIWKGFPFTQIDDGIKLEMPRVVFDGNQWNVQYGSINKNTDNFVVLSLDNNISPTTITAEKISSINSALVSAQGLIIAPGIYHLEGTIVVPNDKIVLGLGLPSLVCQAPFGGCMKVGSEGTHVAGMTFDAGTNGSYSDQNNVLLTVGEKSYGSQTNPTTLQDVYCRVARTDLNQPSPLAYACVQVDSNYVIGENLWLWRADHDKQSLQIPFNINYCKHGLIVNGDNVKMNGLFVEHFNDYQTIWLGKGGKINFYQSELPYFMPTDGSLIECSLPNSADVKKEIVCPSLYIAKSASGFSAQGLGVYSFFPNDLGQKTIKAKCAIKVDSNDASISHVIVRWLNGDPMSEITYMLEDPSGSAFPQGSTVDGNHNKGYAFDTYPPHADPYNINELHNISDSYNISEL